MDTIKAIEKPLAYDFEDNAKFLMTQTTMVNGKAVRDVVQTPLYMVRSLLGAEFTEWDIIQMNVRAGMAKNLYPIGHEFLTHYTYDGTVYDMPWVVLDNDRECTWPDGSKHPGLWIGSKYATIEEIEYDAPEQEEATEAMAQEGLYYRGGNASNNQALNLSVGDAVPYNDYEHVYHTDVNNSSIFYDGYNRYSKSAIRQWLNSAEGKGGWWESQHVGDSAPEGLSLVKGFMAGLDAEFLAIINPVKIQVAANTETDGGVTDVMYDRFFLPSIEEVFGVPEVSGVEGAYFPYWKQVTGFENPTNGSFRDTSENRVVRKIHNPSANATFYLRSVSTGDANYAWKMDRTGYLATGPVYMPEAVLPVCVIS